MQIDLDRPWSLQDEPVWIRVRGVPVDADVTLSLTRLDSSVAAGTSWARFVPKVDGSIDLGRDAPVVGGYRGVDQMGLFWSLDPTVAHLLVGQGTSPRRFLVRARAADEEVVVSLDRAVMSPEIVCEPLREGGLVGTLFHREDGEPRPGLIVLGGSEGGAAEYQAALLASRGYTTLALAYFGLGSLPTHLSMLPLEYVAKGIDWLRALPDVRRRKVGIVGASKGGELALVMAASIPEVIDAVIAVVPSGLAFMGIGTGPTSFPCFFRSSWSRAGRPVPFVPMRMTPSVMSHFTLSRAPIRLANVYEAAMANKGAVRNATIPIGRFGGPILLLSSEEDAIWPSTNLSEIAITQLRAARRKAPYLHIAFSGAGHAVGPPYDPAVTAIPGAFMGRTLLMGGTRAAVARAAVEGWNAVLAFLSEHLGGQS